MIRFISTLSVVWALGFTFMSPKGFSDTKASLTLQTERKVKDAINPLLTKYCASSCNLVDVKIDIDTQISNGDNMGFESALNQPQSPELFVKLISVNVQIDEKVNGLNRERLEKIIQVNLRPLGMKSEISWSSIAVPRISSMSGLADRLKQNLVRKITNILDRIVKTYCPSQCLIERIEVQGAPISLDEAEGLTTGQLAKDPATGGILRIDNIDVEVGIDDKLDEGVRNQILDVMRAKTRFLSGMNLINFIRPFPETYEQKRAKEKQMTEDPYGLEKLRQMLIMFRDLAGTREIISSKETTSESSSTNRMDKTIDSNNKHLSESNLNSDSHTEKNDAAADEMSYEKMATYTGALLLLTTAIIMIFRFSRANRNANEMLIEHPRPSLSKQENNYKEYGNTASNGEEKKDLSMRLGIQNLKEEMMELFMESPKVAKETFTRILKEDGVETTSKYISIFGHLIVFELLEDPNIQRDLYDLSEYYHTSDFTFTPEEEYELLKKLKTRCTASEIRVLTRKASEKFEFLNKLDPGQIYKLISDESTQVQTIVLTQLDRKRRRTVFDMYVGQNKVDLMQHLSLAEAIPKEFMFNVAKALNRKVTSHSEFDVENLRSSDILIDLLEKASLDDQRKLMMQLQETNSDSARSIKMKLVTVEVMPYLKDGHLLELILGMDRNDLMTFLMGTKEHVRDLLLRKAPEELADSWIEDMESMATVDESSYRVAEIQVLARIRGLVNNGVVNLIEINDMIFEGPGEAAFSTEDADTTPLNRVTMAAA